jgi:sec-independent protein translocase protein TatA
MLAQLSWPSGAEWLVILIIALLLFGNRLPSVMRSLGRGVAEFKKGIREGEAELDKPSQSRPADEATAKTESRKEAS